MDECVFGNIKSPLSATDVRRPGDSSPARVGLDSALALRLWLLTLLFAVANHPTALAQYSDAFESGAPRFMLVESDCQAQSTLREISPSLSHAGQACELSELFCTNGTYAYLAMPVEPAAIIDELMPSIWVQCMSAKVRLGVNVVFPNAQHPTSGGRLHAILWGTTYDQPGSWQRLTVDNVAHALTSELPQLRQRYGSKLNFDGAYIDSIVINAYTGPGRYRLKIDDLTMPGFIPISSLGTPVAADWRARWRWRDGLGTEENHWSAATNRRMPVWWQYQGESLPWLSSLGFRGLLLSKVPSPAMLTEAQASRLSVISPPPTHAIAVDEKLWDGVQGWLIGAAVDGRSRPQLESEVSRVAQFPAPLKRPTIAEAMEEYWSFSRVVDELIVPAQANISPGSADEKLTWLRSNLQDTSRLGSGWVSISTDPLPSWIDQVRMAQSIVEPTAPELDTTDAVQLRLQVAKAVAAGARGFLFRSTTPLDDTGAEHQVRVAAMRTINRDLAFISPWVVGGQIAPVPRLNREDYAAAAWSASRSNLVMFVQNSPDAQVTLPPTRDRLLRASMPLPTGINYVLRVTGGNVQSLILTPGPEGMSWEIRDPGPVELCVFTDNPLVERYVSRQLNQTATEAAEDMLDIASHQLQIASRLTAARWPQTIDPLARNYLRTISAAQELVEDGYRNLRDNRASRAIEAGSFAYDAAQMIVYESYRTAISNLAAPQSSPLVLSAATLPFHWSLARSCERSGWRALPLPSSEFASLQGMQDSGWSQQRRLGDRAEMLVELVPASTSMGSTGSDSGNSPTARASSSSSDATGVPAGHGLRLAAAARNGQRLPGGYEGASIYVRSAPAVATRGELVRITGRAVIRHAPSAPGAGLLVYDNKGGPGIGQLIRGQAGESVPIELYRFMTDDAPLRILTELRGECDIVLEGLSLSAIAPAINLSKYATAPMPSSSTPSSSMAPAPEATAPTP